MQTLSQYCATFLLSLGLFVVGCASERHVKDIVANPSPSDNPSEEITSLEREIDSARQARVHILAPTWFSSAEKSLEDAKALRTSGGNFNAMFREIAEGRAQIQRANDTAKESEKILANVLDARDKAFQARERAVKSGATELEDLNDHLLAANERFLSLAEAAEDNKISTIDRRRAEVIAAFRDVEIEAVKKEYLDTAQRVLADAKKRGARGYAPKTLAYAEQMMSTAEKYITSNPDAKSDIQAKSDDAKFHAQRTLNVTAQAQEVANREPEDTVIWMEQSLASVGNELGTEDKRDTRLEDQVALLKESARSLRDKEGVLSRNASSDTMRLGHLEARYQEMAKKFSPSEAEVLQKEGKLILRLKGVKFPSGQARLGQENFALLTKVQEVVGSFPKSEVLIEGHTDSIGTKTANEKLSTERAEAVKQYLTAPGALSEEQIRAVGVGFEKPIATNKTKAGRAANRRIDVVITTSGETPAD